MLWFVMYVLYVLLCFFFFKQKTAYEMRISDWIQTCALPIFGVIDEKGRVLWGDQLVAIYATEILAEHPGATVIADVKASQVLFDRIAELGGKPLMWRTGHSLIKTKMAETGAPLAGEMSGHMFSGDRYYGFDDALYAAIRRMSLLARADR